MIDFHKLSELHNLALKEVSHYEQRRFIYHKIKHIEGRHFIGVIGARGTGKTVFLRQLAKEDRHAFYISVDSLPELDLFETVKNLTEHYGIRRIFFDEIHFCHDYQRHLKKIYDFLRVPVVFTSSASLALHETHHDLSRRVDLVVMHPFSFREYLFFKEGREIPQLSLMDIINRSWQPDHFRFSGHFDAYLRGGLYPFALEEPQVLMLLENIVQKVLHRDIPAIHNLRVAELQTIGKLLSFIGKSAIDGINYSTLSNNLGITKYKAEHYVKLLERAFILNVVWPTGSNVMKESKVALNLPYRLLFRNWEDSIGCIREDFFVQTMLMKGYKLNYLKSTRGAKTPDYLVDTGRQELVVEIGGKNKGREQFKGIDKKKGLILAHSDKVKGIRRPLFLAGYL